MRLIRKEDGDYHLIVNGEIKSLQDFNINKEDCDILTLGYSVERMAQSAFTHPDFGKYKVGSIAYYNGYKDGFNAHKGATCDRLFTILDMKMIFTYARTLVMDSDINRLRDDFIRSILPKTEWDVEFDDQGRLKLKSHRKV